jgi:hypothetical protein
MTSSIKTFGLCFCTNFRYLSWMISVSNIRPFLVSLTYISNILVVECTNCEASRNNCFGPSVNFLITMFFYGCGKENNFFSCIAFLLKLSSVCVCVYIYIYKVDRNKVDRRPKTIVTGSFTVGTNMSPKEPISRPERVFFLKLSIRVCVCVYIYIHIYMYT